MADCFLLFTQSITWVFYFYRVIRSLKSNISRPSGRSDARMGGGGEWGYTLIALPEKGQKSQDVPESV